MTLTLAQFSEDGTFCLYHGLGLDTIAFRDSRRTIREFIKMFDEHRPRRAQFWNGYTNTYHQITKLMKSPNRDALLAEFLNVGYLDRYLNRAKRVKPCRAIQQSVQRKGRR